MKSILVILSALALATVASASCGVAHYVAPVKVHHAAYVAPVVAQYVPIYGATYAPAPGIDAESLKVIIEALKAPQQAQQIAPDNTAILEAIKRISDRLDRLERPQMPSVPANPFEPSRKESRLPTAAEAKCLVCHSPELAEVKGGGFVLPGSGPRGLARSAELVRAGRMPPRSSGIVLSDAEKSAFLSSLSTR